METHLGVLVGCDGREGSLREGEGLENTPADAEHVVRLDDVEARVVAMHGVQNDLQTGGERFNQKLLLQNTHFWKCSVFVHQGLFFFSTYMSVLVERVVGELELEEGDRLLHPVAPRGRRVRVEVRPAGRLGLRFTGHLPSLFIPL